MVKELIRKYLWLIDTISNASPRGLLLEDVCSRWEDRWDEAYNRRSFFNHRQAIEEIFEIEILCNRGTRRYYVETDEYDAPTQTSWLINTFTVNNLLSLSRDRLQGRVSVEDVPSGQKWLLTLMNAMMDNEELEICHRKYTSEDGKTRNVRPYALKEYGKRWYLVAYDLERNGLRMFGLDRISLIRPTGRKFRFPDDFDVDVLLRNSFGAYPAQRKDVRHIVLKATELEAKYLRDLPLHHTQKEVSPGIFTLDVAIMDDLIMELMGRGSRLEVTEPPELRARIAEELLLAAKQYQNNESIDKK